MFTQLLNHLGDDLVDCTLHAFIFYCRYLPEFSLLPSAPSTRKGHMRGIVEVLLWLLLLVILVIMLVVSLLTILISPVEGMGLRLLICARTREVIRWDSL